MSEDIFNLTEAGLAQKEKKPIESLSIPIPTIPSIKNAPPAQDSKTSLEKSKKDIPTAKSITVSQQPAVPARVHKITQSAEKLPAINLTSSNMQTSSKKNMGKSQGRSGTAFSSLTTLSNFDKLDTIKKYVATSSNFFNEKKSKKEAKMEIKRKLEKSTEEEEAAAKTKFMNFYSDKVVSDLDRLYSTAKPGELRSELARIEKKRFISLKIDQQEGYIVDQKNTLNKIISLIDQANKRSRELEEQQKNMDFHSIEDLTMKKEMLSLELEAMRRRVENLEYRNKGLDFMVEARKDDIVVLKKRMTQNRHDLRNRGLKLKASNEKKQAIEMRKSVEMKEMNQLATQKVTSVQFWDKFNDLFLEELSQLEDKLAIEEINKQEEKLQQIEERKAQQEKNEQAVKAKEARNRLYIEERTKLKKEEEDLKKRKAKVSVLMKLGIANKEDFEPRLKFLMTGCDELQKSVTEYNVIIEKKKVELERARELLKNKKYEADQNSLLDTAKGEFSLDIKAENLEKELIQKTAILDESDENLSKSKKTTNKVILGVSRMVYQLNRNKNKDKMFEGSDPKKRIEASNVVDFLSMVGLQLEWMLTTIIKKNTNFRMESVNTDTTYKIPPAFLGINMVAFEDPDVHDFRAPITEKEIEDEELITKEFEDERAQAKYTKDDEMQTTKTKMTKGKMISKS